MKTTLLLSIVALSFSSFGQKKITSTTTYAYEMDGSIYGIDSLENIYLSGQQGITEFAPKLLFNLYYPSFELSAGGDLTNTAPDETHFHTGTSLPLNYIFTYTNNIVNGQVVESASGGSWRTLNEYDAQGNRVKTITEMENNGAWEVQDSSRFSFDALSNLTSRANYEVAFGGGLVSTDTFEYAPGTDQVTRYISYLPPVIGGPLDPIGEYIISYNGTQVEYADEYMDMDGVIGLEWANRAIYEYVGNNPTKYELFWVINDTVQSTSHESMHFHFDANDRHIENVTLSGGGDTTIINRFEYDADDFVTRTETQHLNFDSDLYISQERYFYFDNPSVGLKPMEKVSVSIYPNPVINVLTIDTETSIEFVQVLNSSGQVILEQQSKEMDVSHLPSGVYILSGITESGRFTHRIVKE